MKHASLQKCIAVALALAVWQGAAMAVGKIGRASCRERVCLYV